MNARNSEYLHQYTHAASGQHTQECKCGFAVFTYQSITGSSADPSADEPKRPGNNRFRAFSRNWAKAYVLPT